MKTFEHNCAFAEAYASAWVDARPSLKPDDISLALRAVRAGYLQAVEDLQKEESERASEVTRDRDLEKRMRKDADEYRERVLEENTRLREALERIAKADDHGKSCLSDSTKAQIMDWAREALQSRQVSPQTQGDGVLDNPAERELPGSTPGAAEAAGVEPTQRMRAEGSGHGCKSQGADGKGAAETGLVPGLPTSASVQDSPEYCGKHGAIKRKKYCSKCESEDTK